MVFGQSPLPRALRQASTDPSGCPRQRPQIARDSQTRVSRQMPRAMKSPLQKPIRLAVFAKPRSIIFAVTPPSSFNLTMMFVGLISRWTRFCS